MSIQVVCCMGRKPGPSEPYYILNTFLKSLSKFGFTPVILGDGPGEFNGLLSKAKLLKKAIESGKITADYIIMSDAFDVVYSSSPADIVDKFISMKEAHERKPRVIWNAERACFSDATLAQYHWPCESSFKYLNSGWGVGETQGFLEAMKASPPEELPDDHRQSDGSMHHSCDQNYWMLRMLFGELPIERDTQCELAQAYCDTKIDEFDLESGGKIKNKETGTFPIVHHFNGGSKNKIMKPILAHLGY